MDSRTRSEFDRLWAALKQRGDQHDDQIDDLASMCDGDPTPEAVSR